MFENELNTQKVTINDEKINLSVVNIQDEDHTLGNIVRLQLLRDRTVKFAGYRKPHPLENRVEVKCQTTGEKKPSEAIQDACNDLISHLDCIEEKFRDAMAQYQGVITAAGLPPSTASRLHQDSQMHF